MDNRLNRRVYRAFNGLETKKANKENLIPGLLGFMINGVKTVEVENRPGYVYVRIRNNTNELVMAFNDQVSPVYDLPVLLVRDEIDKTRYKISGRDVGKYENWGSVSAYLPRHANQHSFNPDSGGGGDIVWVYDRQLTPLLVQPSGSNGSQLALINPDIVYSNNGWRVAGGTGTPNLVLAKPTNNQARILLIYLDSNLNPAIVTGTLFDASITGQYAVNPYIPDRPTDSYPLAGVRLVSGTTVILWDNIYDLRPIFRGELISTDTESYVTINNEATLANERKLTAGAGISITDGGAGGNVTVAVTGTLGGGTSIPTYPAIYDDLVFKATGTAINFGDNLTVIATGTSVFVTAIDTNTQTPTYPAIYDDLVFKATGSVINFGNNLAVVVTGTSVFIDATAGGGGGGSPIIYDDSIFKVTGVAIDFGSKLSVAVTGSTAFVDVPDTAFASGSHTHPSLGSSLVFFEDSAFKATGTAVSFNDNLNVVVTGTTIYVSAVSGGGGSGTFDTITLAQQVSNPSAPIAGYTTLFVKDDGLYLIDNGGTLAITPYPSDGWIPLQNSGSFVVADSPSYVVQIYGNVTGTFSSGMKMKLEQQYTQFGIVTNVGGYVSGTTGITLYCGTDYSITGTPISTMYFSREKSPTGFPLNPNKWTVQTTNLSNANQTSAVTGTWYNLGSIQLTVPLGLWNIEYSTILRFNNVGQSYADAYATLSTSNNSESDTELSAWGFIQQNENAINLNYSVYKRKYISLNAKTIYYLNALTLLGLSEVGFRGDIKPTIIRAICGYL